MSKETIRFIGWTNNRLEIWEAWVDGERDQSVLFTTYPGEDVAEAGASALNVRVTESLNVLRVPRRVPSPTWKKRQS